jgi:hypothetical protein
MQERAMLTAVAGSTRMMVRWVALSGAGVALFAACGGLMMEKSAPTGDAGKQGGIGGTGGRIQRAGYGGLMAGTPNAVGGVSSNAGGTAGRVVSDGGASGNSDEGGNAGEPQGGMPPFELECDACTPTSDNPDCDDCPGKALRSANDHTCLLGADRKVTCWGANVVFGKPGSYVDAASPPTTPFERIAPDSGLDASGRLIGWGYHEDGGRPARMPGPFRFIAEDGRCAVRTDGAVQCGMTVIDGEFRAVVSTYSTCTLDLEGTPECSGPELANPPSGAFLRLSMGRTEVDATSYAHVCGIRTDRTLACWGHDDHGQTTPPPGTFRRITSAGSQSCAIRTDGVTLCWGNVATAPPSDNFVSISLDDHHGCGLRQDGKVRCWGSDRRFQLRPPPELAFEDERFTSFAVAGDESHPAGEVYTLQGETHACGLREDATLRCWGVIEQPPSGGYVQVSSGPRSSCAVATDSRLVCWGAAQNFVGLRDEGAMGGFEQVSTGAHSVCAVRTDGSIHCWQSGNRISYVPLPPPAGTFSKVLVSGSMEEDFAEGDGESFAHACALGTDGAIYCWGYPQRSTLYVPTFREWSIPGPFVDLAVGHTDVVCGLHSDGTGICGEFSEAAPTGYELTELDGTFEKLAVGGGFRDKYGVRPDGSLVRANDGVQLLEGDFVDVSAGRDYFCGLTTDGEVRCGGTRVR